MKESYYPSKQRTSFTDSSCPVGTFTEQPSVERKKWGFQIPTCFIDTQSAPALAGVEPEQKYMRAFLMAGQGDLVVTDFPLNQEYVGGYLGGVLKLDLPQFMVIPDFDQPTLSNNLLKHPESIKAINQWLTRTGGQLLYFNITQKEIYLTDALGNPKLVCGNIKEVINLGTKTGFKRLCQELGLPTPKGGVCFSVDGTVNLAQEIIGNGGAGFIKAKEGTGGTDLQSNVLFSASELGKSGLDIERYIRGKLEKFGGLLGDEWVVEEMVEGRDGSIHFYIDPCDGFSEHLVLGALSHDNSYVGGYYPYQMTPIEFSLMALAESRLMPEFQKRGVTGFHCFDFKGEYFLEDNVRPGALDFINQFVARIAEKHFFGYPYSWYHCHVPIPKPTNFETVFSLLSSRLSPLHLHDGCFAAVSNVEILPYGRALDLTAVSVGENCSVEKARAYFEDTKNYIKGQI